MRLTSVELHNFGCYLSATVRLDSATVVIGPNDSGKTTLIRAIRCLFTETDSDGQAFDFWNVKSTPLKATDYLFDVFVRGEFGDLSAPEQEAWGDLSFDGVLSCGTYFTWQDRPGDLPGVRCLVMPTTQADHILQPVSGDGESFSRWLATMEENRRIGQALLDPSVRLFGDSVWIPWTFLGAVGGERLAADGWTSEPLRRWRAHPTASAFTSILGGIPFVGDENLVHVRGPEHGPPSVMEILRPIIRRRLERRLGADDRAARAALTSIDGALEAIYAESESLLAEVADRYATALERFSGHRGGAAIHFDRRMLSTAILDLILERASVFLTRDRPGDPHGWDSYSIESLGAGGQRAAALSALELYSDAGIWDPSDWLVLLVEEPEVGLYPAAQRRLASALRRLPAYGVQLITTSHSPVMVDTVSREGIRVARPGTTTVIAHEDEEVLLNDHRIDEMDDARSLMNILGCAPSDILLSSRFVLLEGHSDAAIFKVWARTNGGDLDSTGITLLPVGGHGAAKAAAMLLSTVLVGTTLDVILDNGSETARQRIELESQFGDRLRVRLLNRTEIEGYFSPPAVHQWLALNGASPLPDMNSLAENLSSTRRKAALRRLAQHHLGRDYRVVEDGVAIAGLMTEAQLDTELRSLLTELEGS